MQIESRNLLFIVMSLVSADSLQAQFGVGPIHKNAATAVVVGLAAVGVGVGIGVTYLILHNRGTATGCVSEAGGKKALTTGAKQTYLLLESGAALTSGERYKLKGRITGPSVARTFTVDKMLKDFGACP